MLMNRIQSAIKSALKRVVPKSTETQYLQVVHKLNTAKYYAEKAIDNAMHGKVSQSGQVAFMVYCSFCGKLIVIIDIDYIEHEKAAAGERVLSC